MDKDNKVSFNKEELLEKDKKELTKEEKSFLRKEYWKWVGSEFKENKILAFLLLCIFITSIRLVIAVNNRMTPEERELAIWDTMKENAIKDEKDNHRNKKDHKVENKPIEKPIEEPVEVESPNKVKDKAEQDNSVEEPKRPVENEVVEKPNDADKDIKEERYETIETEFLMYETIKKENPNLEEGMIKVVQAGKQGVKEIVTIKIYKGDKLISKEVNETITEPVQNEILEIGTKKPEKPAVEDSNTVDIDENIDEVEKGEGQ